MLLRIKRFCAFTTGFIFFFSGILKILDPVGAGLVMEEYLHFFHLDFISFAAKGLGTTLALVETLIGAALITGVCRKHTAIAAISLQAFFTLLTVILVIFNPEMDCGCFGEAIHLTHLETFIKNLVICALLAFAFIPFRDFGEPLKRKYVSFSIVSVSVLAFCIYSLLYIPLIDFTEFKHATALKAGNTFQVSEEDIYEAVFIYEKDGKRETFDLQHLPDSTWTFVSAETKLKEEYQDNSANLSFYDEDGNYMDTLATKGHVMVIPIYDTDMSISRWNDIAEFIGNVSDAGYTPLMLVSSTPDDMNQELKDVDEESRILIERYTYYSDYKTLLTLNRSNGGAVWFCDGYLICKWARRSLPDYEELSQKIKDDATEAIIEKETKGNLAFQGFLLYVFAVMLLM